MTRTGGSYSRVACRKICLQASTFSQSCLAGPVDKLSRILSRSSFLLARPPYDLNVDVEFVDPTSAAPGDRVRVFTTIQASGSLTQWLSYSIRLSTDAVLSDDDRVARSSRSLVFGGSRKVTFRPTIPDDLVAGRYFIGVMFTTEGDLNPQDNVSNSVEINISE